MAGEGSPTGRDAMLVRHAATLLIAWTTIYTYAGRGER
jgi:hypothetical protein